MPCLLVTEAGIEALSTTKSPQESTQSLLRSPLASGCLSVPMLIPLLKGRGRADHPARLAAGCRADSDGSSCPSPQTGLSRKDKIPARGETGTTNCLEGEEMTSVGGFQLVFLITQNPSPHRAFAIRRYKQFLNTRKDLLLTPSTILIFRLLKDTKSSNYS